MAPASGGFGVHEAPDPSKGAGFGAQESSDRANPKKFTVVYTEYIVY